MEAIKKQTEAVKEQRRIVFEGMALMGNALFDLNQAIDEFKQVMRKYACEAVRPRIVP